VQAAGAFAFAGDDDLAGVAAVAGDIEQRADLVRCAAQSGGLGVEVVDLLHQALAYGGAGLIDQRHQLGPYLIQVLGLGVADRPGGGELLDAVGQPPACEHGFGGGSRILRQRVKVQVGGNV
jgi:hypothetical protein